MGFEIHFSERRKGAKNTGFTILLICVTAVKECYSLSRFLSGQQTMIVVLLLVTKKC